MSTRADDGGARERVAELLVRWFHPNMFGVVAGRSPLPGQHTKGGCMTCEFFAEEIIRALTPAPNEPGEEGWECASEDCDLAGYGIQPEKCPRCGSGTALALKTEQPVAEYQWRSTYDRPGKWWNGSKEEVESHAKVGCETRELFTRPPVEPGAAREAPWFPPETIRLMREVFHSDDYYEDPRFIHIADMMEHYNSLSTPTEPVDTPKDTEAKP